MFSRWSGAAARPPALVARPPALVAHVSLREPDDELILRKIISIEASMAQQELEVDRLQRQLNASTRARLVFRQVARPVRTSIGVLLRHIGRERNLWRFLSNRTIISARVLVDLTLGNRLGASLLDVLPHSSRLVVHAPAIYAHIDKLARHVPGIVQILDANLHHVEPHLDAILERFDDIEPHLPWVLEHIDELAPYCGEMLKHIDSLMLYASSSDSEVEQGTYEWAERLLPYVPAIIPHLDELEPHLPYLRPHLSQVYPYLPRLAPYIGRFAKHAVCSKNADLLLWYFGWVLRVPLLHHVFRIPGVPSICAWVSGWLPRRWVRGRHCIGVECSVEGLYDGSSSWNRLLPPEQW